MGLPVVRRTRRLWSDDETRSICLQTTAPDVSVVQVARRYGLNADLNFRWVVPCDGAFDRRYCCCDWRISRTHRESGFLVQCFKRSIRACSSPGEAHHGVAGFGKNAPKLKRPLRELVGDAPRFDGRGSCYVHSTAFQAKRSRMMAPATRVRQKRSADDIPSRMWSQRKASGPDQSTVSKRVDIHCKNAKSGADGALPIGTRT